MVFIKKILYIYVLVFTFFISNVWAIQQTYTIEEINDPGFEQYPPTPPVHPVTEVFSASSKNHNKIIEVSTKKQGNISITIENTGNGLIKNPYLYGPQGYDYRDLEKLSTKIVEGVDTEEHKFLRIHSWSDEHLIRHEGAEYLARDASATIRRLNQFGGAMCGEMVDVLGGMLYYTPPVGSMYIRKIDLGDHQPAEAWFDGSWHAVDASPELRWVYYDYDNESYAPSWSYLHNNIDPLMTQIYNWVGWDTSWAISSCSCNSHNNITNVQKVGFIYDLRPQESLVMYREMRGRFDHVNRDEELREGRHTVDYGSAVFSYKPDFSTSIFRQYASSLNNVKASSTGLVPVDSSTTSSLVFPMSSKDWRFVGSQVKADFKQGGKVYISTTSASGDWQQLYTYSIADNIIEGKEKYWIKVEFKGAGSGINRLEIAGEIQMNPLIMPWLEYGKNNIRFTADNMNGSHIKVTYKYDDQAKRYTYEPATNDYGRHIWWRIGGTLVHNWVERGHTNKAQYYRRINEDPEGTVSATLEIYAVSGVKSGQKVRTLFRDKPLTWGYYKWYWDGKNDDGHKLLPGMYSYKIIQKGADPYGNDSNEGLRLYLFDKMWPPASTLSDVPKNDTMMDAVVGTGNHTNVADTTTDTVAGIGNTDAADTVTDASAATGNNADTTDTSDSNNSTSGGGYFSPFIILFLFTLAIQRYLPSRF